MLTTVQSNVHFMFPIPSTSSSPAVLLRPFQQTCVCCVRFRASGLSAASHILIARDARAGEVTPFQEWFLWKQGTLSGAASGRPKRRLHIYNCYVGMWSERHETKAVTMVPSVPASHCGSWRSGLFAAVDLFQIPLTLRFGDALPEESGFGSRGCHHGGRTSLQMKRLSSRTTRSF